METEKQYNYQVIEKAISFMVDHLKQQPGLSETAAHVNLSPAHFQTIFTEWAGVTSQKFAQYLTLNYAKQHLNKIPETNLFQTALTMGLSGINELYKLSVKLERISPSEYKNGGQTLHINYSFALCNFGEILVASTSKGICYLSFFDHKKIALQLLKDSFPNAKYEENFDELHESVIEILQNDFNKLKSIKLHLKGTDFQLKVWEALLNIPFGQVNTYGRLASELGSPNATRAVGTAIGNNPIAFIIPCHRVIQNSGKLGGYMWGLNRKRMILGWEAARVNNN